MRNLLLILLLTLSPYISLAQLHTSHQKGKSFIYFMGQIELRKQDSLMDNFVKYYNRSQADSILILFDNLKSAEDSKFYPQQSLDSMFKKHKKIESYKLVDYSVYDYTYDSSDVFLKFKIAFSDSLINVEANFDEGFTKIVTLFILY